MANYFMPAEARSVDFSTGFDKDGNLEPFFVSTCTKKKFNQTFYERFSSERSISRTHQ